MGLIVAQWGGQIYDSNSAGNPIEIWTNTVCLASEAGPVDVGAILGAMVPLVSAWVSNPQSKISATCRLEYLKVNEVNPVTGLQITDPTNEHSYLDTNVRGGAAQDDGGDNPITVACRITLDDGTRNRRRRGGFYAPRVNMGVLHNGRWNVTQLGDFNDSAVDLVQGINDIPNVVVGIWSRMDNVVTPVTRLRVGNVPDNISKRKNDLAEAYIVNYLT